MNQSKRYVTNKTGEKEDMSHNMIQRMKHLSTRSWCKLHSSSIKEQLLYLTVIKKFGIKFANLLNMYEKLPITDEKSIFSN